MKVYVLFVEDVYNGESSQSFEVYASKDDAIKQYEKELFSMSGDVENDESWTIEETKEETRQYVRMFEAYEEGYYSQNHLFIYVKEQELKK